MARSPERAFVGKAARLHAVLSRAQEAPRRVAARRPEDVETAVAAYLADRKADLVLLIDDDATSIISQHVEQVNVLGELSKHLGKLAAASENPGSLKRRSDESPDEWIATLRRIITPEGWQEKLRAPLEKIANDALAKILAKDKDTSRLRALRLECLHFIRFLDKTDDEGQQAEAKMSRNLQVRVGG